MKKIFTLITLLALATFSFGQELKATADEQFGNQEWQAAAKNYKKYLKKNESDSSAWYNLGKSQLQLASYDDAIESFQMASETNFSAPFVAYNLAKAHALNKDKDKALKTLQKGVENGLSAFSQMESDTAFAILNKTDAFKKVVENAKSNFYPCLKSEIRKHFDFWVGEWNVYVNGTKVGENSITRANGGCAIHESYTTPRGYTGQSINYYDPQDKKWHQVWVGSAGGVLDYVEVDKSEGMLQFECDFINAQGNLSYSRLTFTANPDGTVRQLFESSSDGENWTSGFDGLYKKKEQSQ